MALLLITGGISISCPASAHPPSSALAGFRRPDIAIYIEIGVQLSLRQSLIGESLRSLGIGAIDAPSMWALGSSPVDAAGAGRIDGADDGIAPQARTSS